MSMEFLTAPWHHLFFGPQTEKYELSHAEDALLFIPYGCLVDHFQEEVYRHPEMTPEERNALWLRLKSVTVPIWTSVNCPLRKRRGLAASAAHLSLSFLLYRLLPGPGDVSPVFPPSPWRTGMPPGKKSIWILCVWAAPDLHRSGSRGRPPFPVGQKAASGKSAKQPFQWTEAHLVE